MRQFISAFLILFCFSFASAQDTSYVRRNLKYLTSAKCFGRGYVKGGLAKAEKFITHEIKQQGAQPLFGTSYVQTFTHAVNTFPKQCKVKLNGKKLVPGLDFILDPSSSAGKGTFSLTKADSANYIGLSDKQKVIVSLKNKLTFSVAPEAAGACILELNKKRFTEVPQEIELNVDAKWLPHFESRNIGCYLNGSSGSDSMIVFSAHYDHLGGMDNKTFFPGANDNASGTSMVLDLLRYYKQHPPRYKTVFLFFAGEEEGLLGSKYLTHTQALALNKIKFLINLDLLGTGDDGIMVVNGAIHEKELGLMNSINAEKKLVKEIKKRGKAANSDHYWFSEAGVPCFFIYTLGGVTAYHDINDIEKTLPLTDYTDIFTLITHFVALL
jgi:hypothetical protein